MTGPGGLTATALSREVGISQPTLSRWLREAGRLSGVSDSKPSAAPERPERRPEDWTSKEKVQAVIESAHLDEGDLGVWLRQKGLKSEHLRRWREAMEDGADALFTPPAPRMAAAERKEVKRLEAELRRKDKALAETAALLVLQGKVQALLEERDGSTRQTNDSTSWRPSGKRRRRERG
jgi:hypothetical protein